MGTVIWIVVAVVVVVAVVALVALLLRRRSDHQRQQQLAHADDLRGRAAGHLPDVRSAEERAQQADAEAERARARADQAEQTAAGAHRDLAQEQAAQEDVVRRADEVDPRVDTSAPDYEPIVGPDMKGIPADGVDDADGRHRAG
ncbi:hypothetical protein [Nocardioides sp.]|uniref:hypothetical protein n=1 Tax=Nocardioides sp. TaxID=35761 RepID=UPI002717825C|nr:hypothetical protein [Nocardioides sp.]MDO9454535.1 hypothetical protein [Nocardioides sp.]